MKSKIEQINEIILGVVVGMLILFFITRFFSPLHIRGSSMYPTLKDGDKLVFNKHAYKSEDPKRGDIVLFRLVNETEDFYVKRVIGIEGDSIEIKDNIIYLNDEFLYEPYLENPDNGPDMAKVTIEKGKYFVMGDNRGNSLDSRSFGPVLRDEIVGSVMD